LYSTNKHHLKNSQKQQQKKRSFWEGNGEGGGCFKNVSRQKNSICGKGHSPKFL
jgi:hypothetical protein